MQTSSTTPERAKRLVDLDSARLLGESFPSILLVRSHWQVRAAARYTFVFLGLAIIAMIFVPWQQTSKGFGRVVAYDPQERAQMVTASAKGIITKIREGLREGSFVKKDDVILEIEPLAKDAQQQVANQVAELKNKLETQLAKESLARQAVELQASAGKATLAAAKDDVEGAKAKVAQAKDKVQGYEATVERSKADFERTAQLLPDGLKSQKDFVKDKETYQKAVASFEEGENGVIEAMKNLAAKENELLSKKDEVEVKNRETSAKLQEVLSEMASIRKMLSETEQKASEYGDRLTMKSPVDGYLHELNALTGSSVVKEGDPLFTVVPQTTDMAVELLVRGNDVSLLNVNDEVRLQFEGYPAVQFVGWPSVARGTFGGQIALINPTDDGQGNFRIVVTPRNDQNGDINEEPWPEVRYLRQGVLANGWILLSKDGRLSRVPLGYEIWRQLNGFPPVVSSKKPDDGSGMDAKKDKSSKIKLPK